MRKFVYRKLIRDKILADMLAHGEQPVHRKLDETEYRQRLKDKFLEEAAELDPDDPTALAELADLQEILDCLRDSLGITSEQLRIEQDRKNAKAGSFRDQVFIDTVEIPDDNPWIKYLEQHPERYPEILD